MEAIGDSRDGFDAKKRAARFAAHVLVFVVEMVFLAEESPWWETFIFYDNG